MAWPKPAQSPFVRLASEAITSNYWGFGPASGAVVASGATVLALGPGPASGPTVSALAPDPTLGPTVSALAPGSTLGPTVFALAPGPTLGPTVFALALDRALGTHGVRVGTRSYVETRSSGVGTDISGIREGSRISPPRW